MFNFVYEGHANKGSDEAGRSLGGFGCDEGRGAVERRSSGGAIAINRVSKAMDQQQRFEAACRGSRYEKETRARFALVDDG